MGVCRWYTWKTDRHLNISFKTSHHVNQSQFLEHSPGLRHFFLHRIYSLTHGDTFIYIKRWFLCQHAAILASNKNHHCRHSPQVLIHIESLHPLLWRARAGVLVHASSMAVNLLQTGSGLQHSLHLIHRPCGWLVIGNISSPKDKNSSAVLSLPADCVHSVVAR